MKNQNKINDKRIAVKSIKVVIFILVFTMLLEILSATLFSKSNATTFKNNFKNAYNYVNEIENTIDIVALGNSNMYSAICPVRLWDKQGYTSTIIASPRQTAAITCTMLEDVLKTQNPQLVILETDMFYEGVELNENINDNSQPKKRLPAIPYITDEKITTDIQNRFTVFLLHDQWKLMASNPASTGEDTVFNHGYFFDDSIKETEPNDNMNYTEKYETLPDETLLYLNKMLEMCRKRGIRLMFIGTPSLNSWSYARHNAVEKYAVDNGIDYLDFNTLDDYEIEYTREFRDKGYHLNFYGAGKITEYVGDFLLKNYSDKLSDKRNNIDFSSWNNDKTRFAEYYDIENF